MTAAFFLLIVLILGVEVARRLLRKDVSYKDAIDGFQTTLTATAILLGGYWYFVDRKGAPHADLQAQINIVPVGSKSIVAVEATVTAKNLGEQLLRIRRVDLRLQEASLDPIMVQQLAGSGMNDWSQKLGNQALFSEAEFQWPTRKQFNSPVEHEIEPGESDIITATFFVPCSVKEVRLSASVEKASAAFWSREPDMFWKVRQFASTEDACHRAAGGKAHAS